MRYSAGWGSHIPMLVAAVQATDGPVLELGVGVFSTPVLHWLCVDRKRRLVSYDDDDGWVAEHESFNVDGHQVVHVPDWDRLSFDGVRWSVAFVDNAPAASRAPLVARLAPITDILVVHDADETRTNGDPYHHDFSGFRFRYDYRPRIRPYTTVVSDSVDVVSLMKRRV